MPSMPSNAIVDPSRGIWWDLADGSAGTLHVAEHNCDSNTLAETLSATLARWLAVSIASGHLGDGRNAHAVRSAQSFPRSGQVPGCLGAAIGAAMASRVIPGSAQAFVRPPFAWVKQWAVGKVSNRRSEALDFERILWSLPNELSLQPVDVRVDT